MFASSMSRPVKRSFTIGGHRTSISLEAPFWDALKAAAAQERMPLSNLIGRIDAERGEQRAVERGQHLAARLLSQATGGLPAQSNRQPGAAGLDSRLDGAIGTLGGSGGR